MTIFNLNREFQREKINLKKYERKEGPQRFVTEENITDLRKLFSQDKRMAYIQIEETLGLNALIFLSILKDLLLVKNLVAFSCYIA